MNYSRSNLTLIVCDLNFLSQSTSCILFLLQLLNCFAMCTLQLIRTEIQYSSQIRAIVHNDHQKLIFLVMLLLLIFLGLYIYITQNKMNILGLTRQQKIAWKSGRKFILKFSSQADFNFVQPWWGPGKFVTFHWRLFKIHVLLYQSDSYPKFPRAPVY